jgi:hypothetical protein
VERKASFNQEEKGNLKISASFPFDFLTEFRGRMDLQTFVAVAQIVSAVVVTLTLIAVIISLRQNTRSQKALAVESLAAAITAINVPAMQSPALGAALAKATVDWNSASRDERMIAHFFLFSFFKLLENAWYQEKAGILDKAQWIGWETMLRKYYHAEGVQRAWWPARKNSYSPEFQKFLSETKSPEELAALNELFA